MLAAALAAQDCGLVLTTYEQLRMEREMLLPVRWGVVVLDEGHKIRNPDAEVRAHQCIDWLAWHMYTYRPAIAFGGRGARGDGSAKRRKEAVCVCLWAHGCC